MAYCNHMIKQQETWILKQIEGDKLSRPCMKPPAEHYLNTFAAFSHYGKPWNFINYSVSTAPGFSLSISPATATTENQGLMHWNPQHRFKKHLQPKREWMNCAQSQSLIRKPISFFAFLPNLRPSGASINILPAICMETGKPQLFSTKPNFMLQLCVRECLLSLLHRAY